MSIIPSRRIARVAYEAVNIHTLRSGLCLRMLLAEIQRFLDVGPRKTAAAPVVILISGVEDRMRNTKDTEGVIWVLTAVPGGARAGGRKKVLK